MKNKISLALKDPILQQGFEIICKENTDLKNRNQELLESCEGATMMYKDLQNAKEIIKKLCNCIRTLNNPNTELTNVDSFLEDAENFVKG